MDKQGEIQSWKYWLYFTVDVQHCKSMWAKSWTCLDWLSYLSWLMDGQGLACTTDHQLFQLTKHFLQTFFFSFFILYKFKWFSRLFVLLAKAGHMSYPGNVKYWLMIIPTYPRKKIIRKKYKTEPLKTTTTPFRDSAHLGERGEEPTQLLGTAITFTK